MSTTTRYPQSGEPATIHFEIASKYPTREEAAKLTNIPIDKKPVSGEEAKDALKWFAVGIIAAVAMWFFGRWVIAGFRGPGVLFFGYGTAYIVAPISLIFGISSLFKLFRSAQKTKPEDALRWVYEVSYLGEDAVNERFGKTDYAIATLERIVPDAMGFNRDAARAYIVGFRETLTKAMEATTAKVRENEPPGDWREGGAVKQLKFDGTRELYPGILEMSATITYQDILTRSDDKTTRSTSSPPCWSCILSV